MNKLDLLKLLLDDEASSESVCSSDDNCFLAIGGKYLIRTVTMIYTGQVKALNKDSILLENACWIPETERWADCVKNVEFKEVEPYTYDVVVAKGGILDITKLDFLPTKQK